MTTRPIYYGQIHIGEFEQKILSCLSSEDCSVRHIQKILLQQGVKAPTAVIRDRLEVLAHFKYAVKSENSKPHLFLYRKVDNTGISR